MTDCVVIGGGLIGMLTARELALAGLSVSVLERGGAGRESSWAGGGILSPLYPWRYPAPVSALARWSHQHYPQLAATLERESGVDPQYTRSGLLVVDADERARALAWAADWGQEMHFLTDSRTVQQCEPSLAPSHQQALWMPQVAQVRNPRMVKALRGALLRQGVALREDCEVQGLAVAEGRVQGVDTAAGRVTADKVVVAGGAWSHGLLQPLGLALPVEPVRGQMILFKGPAGLVRRIVLYRDRYVIPRRDGRVLVGSTLERVGFHKDTTPEAREDLQAAALELVPALGEFEIEHHWSGLRPGSPLGIPFIGAHPRVAGLYVNAGHFRNGVILGPASARLLADQMLGQNSFTDPAPYAPGAAAGVDEA